MKGKVQTVLGPIKGEELGITLVHEHLLVDATCAFMEPSDSREEHLAHEPVSLDNIGDIRFAPRSNIDNLCMFDEIQPFFASFMQAPWLVETMALKVKSSWVIPRMPQAKEYRLTNSPP